jgi:hypothetical protein
MIHSKSEISKNLENNYLKFIAKLNDLDQHFFELTPNGKWSPAMQLDHLIKSVKPLNQAFKLPTFCFKLLFGKIKRENLTYDNLVDLYLAKIKMGAVATGAFIPPKIEFSKRPKLIEKFTLENRKFISSLEKFTESDLDTVLLPHPLLGKITIREMYFFTIYHIEHHLEIIKKIAP